MKQLFFILVMVCMVIVVCGFGIAENTGEFKTKVQQEEESVINEQEGNIAGYVPASTPTAVEANPLEDRSEYAEDNPDIEYNPLDDQFEPVWGEADEEADQSPLSDEF